MLGAPAMTLGLGMTPGDPELISKYTEMVKGIGSGARQPQFKPQFSHWVTGLLSPVAVNIL